MNTRKVELSVPENKAGQRLDAFLATAGEHGISRSQLKKNLLELTVNGRPAKLAAKVKPGDRIILSLEEPDSFTTAEPQDILPAVIYEDEHLIVCNKPYGMPVHPSAGHPDGTLVNGLRFHCINLPGENPLRPGIVHRLDKDTSGLIVCAKTGPALEKLSAIFKSRTIQKTYRAIIRGRLPASTGEIEAPVGRDPRNRKKMAVVPTGKPARTGYRIIQEFPGYTFVEILLYTGRTHQIRVHFRHIGHPVCGDPIYGRADHLSSKLCLAATELEFIHPFNGTRLCLQAPLPQHMESALQQLRTQTT